MTFHQLPVIMYDMIPIFLGHTPFTAVLTNRHRNLNMVWRQWKDGDIKGAVQIAINMNDQSTLVDFLSVLSLKQ